MDAASENIRAVVGEAAAWCVLHASADDPAGSLRRLPNPADRHGPLDEPRSSLWRVTFERRVALAHADATPAADLAGGRLLVYLPDENLADGAAELNTRGFHDVDNMPPWDTWIALVTLGDDRALIAYVPPVFLHLAYWGMEINPESCLLWLDEAGHAALGLQDLPASAGPGDFSRVPPPRA